MLQSVWIKNKDLIRESVSITGPKTIICTMKYILVSSEYGISLAECTKCNFSRLFKTKSVVLVGWELLVGWAPFSIESGLNNENSIRCQRFPGAGIFEFRFVLSGEPSLEFPTDWLPCISKADCRVGYII